MRRNRQHHEYYSQEPRLRKKARHHQLDASKRLASCATTYRWSRRARAIAPLIRALELLEQGQSPILNMSRVSRSIIPLSLLGAGAQKQHGSRVEREREIAGFTWRPRPAVPDPRRWQWTQFPRDDCRCLSLLEGEERRPGHCAASMTAGVFQAPGHVMATIHLSFAAIRLSAGCRGEGERSKWVAPLGGDVSNQL